MVLTRMGDPSKRLGRRIDHTAIVVADMDEAVSRWEALTGGRLTARLPAPDQEVEVAFIQVGGTQIELIRPISAGSGVARFLTKHGECLHHIAVRVDDIEAEIARLMGQGMEMIDARPRPGVHGRIAFVHPRSTGGVLLELVEPAEEKV